MDPSSISTDPDDATNPRRAQGSGRRRGSNSFGLSALLLFSVVCLTVIAWVLASLHQLSEDNSVLISGAEARVALLEDRLRTTDLAMTETGEDTQEQLGFWKSEVRKLWVVANERNRRWIKDNEVELDKLQGLHAELVLGIRDLSGAVSRHEAAFDQQEEIIDQLTSITLQVKGMLDRQRDLIDRENASRQKLNNIQSILSARVLENEKAVQAIDAYRLQLNNRLKKIEITLDDLSVREVDGVSPKNMLR